MWPETPAVLIDELKEIQERAGYLPEAEIQEYSARTNTPLYQIEAVASFYPFFRRAPPPRAAVAVCSDLSCHLRGAEALFARLEGLAKGREDVELTRCSCIGLCDQAPAVLWNEHPVTAAALPEDPFAGGLGAQNRADRMDQTDRADPSDRMGGSRVTAGAPPQPFTIDPYAGPGEYRVLARVGADLSADAIVAVFKESGLRGMGGAGFPTGMKWELVRAAPGAPKYVICNADESEPGTFKDRALLEHAPHLVLEGILIAARLVGAAEAIVYLRHEYEASREALARELERARSAGALADSPPVRLFVSAGGYICGEETALLEALEGKRAEPRNKPPFPGTHGLFGRPTLINNVESFALVPAILERGAAWYRSIGVNGGVGPKLLALSGDVRRPGVYEVPLGTPIDAFIEECGGGVSCGRSLKAIMPGGPSSGFLPPSLAGTPLEFRALSQLGSMLGSGAVIALDETRCMLDCALNVVRFFRNESCGKCVPCRAGSQQLVEILTRWQVGKGSREEVELVGELSQAMADASICGLGQIAPMPIVSALKYWPDEILAHALEGRCPAGVCHA